MHFSFRKIIFVTLTVSWVLAAPVHVLADKGGARLPVAPVMIVDIKQSGHTSLIERMSVESSTLNPIRPLSLSPKRLGSHSRLLIMGADDKVLFDMAFTYPKLITVPMPLSKSKGDGIPPVIPIKNPEVTLVVPYIPEAETIQVMGEAEGSPLSSRSVKDAVFEEGIEGKALVPLSAPFHPGCFSILIMASGYDSSNMHKFDALAGRIKQRLLETPPFREHVADININLYRNEKDLGCHRGCSGIDRLLCCRPSKVIRAASLAGFYYDEIIIIHNTNTYAGGGYRDDRDGYRLNSESSFTVVYDGDLSVEAAIHEFGHSFGNLCDEYAYGDEGYQYNDCVNCRSSCDQWLTHSDGCQRGCDAEALYFRPEGSVMYQLHYGTFNQPSIKAAYPPDGLEKRLNYFITR